MDDFGKKGLNVLSITNESRDTVLKFLAQVSSAPVSYTVGLGGGHGNYPSRGIPAAWLIGADGKVVWAGNPGSLSEKVIQEELKKVKVTEETKAVKATKALEFADAQLAAKQYLVASGLLDRIVREHKGTEAAKKAEERKVALEKDEAAKKEIAAQKTLEKIVGGIEMPKEKYKSKERDAKKVQLEAFIKKNKEEAPGAAEIATQWVRVVAEDWKREDK